MPRCRSWSLYRAHSLDKSSRIVYCLVIMNKRNLCLDCQKPVPRYGALRCRSCWHRKRRMEAPHCVDCGAQLKRRSAGRCVHCAGQVRRTYKPKTRRGARFCVDCGKKIDGEKRCRQCHNQAEREGRIWNNPRSGPNHPNWRGGRSLTQDGYVNTAHPETGKRVLEHRLVMEQKLGRPLLPTETVHHLNGDRTDNRPENLELWGRRHGRGIRGSLPHCPTCTCGE